MEIIEDIDKDYDVDDDETATFTVERKYQP